MNVHIFRARDQSATNFVIDVDGLPPKRLRTPRNRLLWTMCCDKRRPAKNLIVHVYYDGIYYFCKAGKGCKDPAFIAEKKRREFKNRSVAQQMRRASERAQHHKD